MKHVFVETNFLVDPLRPFPSKDAGALFARNDGVDLRLYIPWRSQSEAWRTLSDRIVREDPGFTDAMMKFAVRRWLASQHPPLVAEYASCGLAVRQDFRIP